MWFKISLEIKTLIAEHEKKNTRGLRIMELFVTTRYKLSVVLRYKQQFVSMSTRITVKILIGTDRLIFMLDGRIFF